MGRGLEFFHRLSAMSLIAKKKIFTETRQRISFGRFATVFSYNQMQRFGGARRRQGQVTAGAQRLLRHWSSPTW
jgi:hypothetical protein